VPHARRVLYLADQEFDGVVELFAGYLGRPVRRASPPDALRTLTR
jgi:hypothetical protein